MAVFVKAADLGSFAAAADALGMSAPMIGKHVGFLEERLGARLLNRTTRRQSLTAIGQAFYDRCRAIIADAEAAEALVHDLATTPSGRLRVNAPLTFGALGLAPLITRYLADHPRVEVELTLTDRFVDIVDEGYDAVVRLGELKDSALAARPLAPLRLIACAAPSYLARCPAPTQPEDLAGHECLGYVFWSGFPFAEWHFTKDGRVHVVQVRSRFQVNDARVLHAAAVDGCGIILQADFMVGDDLRAGRLVELLPGYAAPSRAMHVLFSAHRPQTPKLRSFLDRVAATFGP